MFTYHLRHETSIGQLSTGPCLGPWPADWIHRNGELCFTSSVFCGWTQHEDRYLRLSVLHGIVNHDAHIPAEETV